MSQLFTEKEVRRLIPIGHKKYYELIGSGELQSVKIGRRRFVSDQAVNDFIERLGTPTSTPTR